MNEQEYEYLKQLEQQLDASRNKENLQYAASILQETESQNLVEWQLDFKKELLDIERLLRKQKIEKKKDGSIEYVDPPEEEQLLNERGIQAVLAELRLYLNKNIVLSNFDQDTINARLLQLGHALRRLIFLNYKEFGMTTAYRQKHYEIIVINILHVIEAAYNRAFKGGERESLRTARMVSQNQPMGYQQPVSNYGNPNLQRRGSKLNPLNWF